MYHVLLKCLSSTHNRLRTERINGVTPQLPEKGEHFTIISKPLNKEASCRVVTTSPVRKLRVRRLFGKRVFIVDTEYSRYRLVVVRQLTAP